MSSKIFDYNNQPIFYLVKNQNNKTQSLNLENNKIPLTLLTYWRKKISYYVVWVAIILMYFFLKNNYMFVENSIINIVYFLIFFFKKGISCGYEISKNL